ncbi:hypothetical protein [Methylorubrum sp. SL192]|uniref:hypothetical protein n=1 Tax=Methylorubrum sp. SL192 TaxID=2995167 RepID=UPI00227665CA|nr:hypothetical protein [Methylorubrum sp. SL192]MCY1643360.1 hypothetical protein [Methylorubrum sp. SL192]
MAADVVLLTLAPLGPGGAAPGLRAGRRWARAGLVAEVAVDAGEGIAVNRLDAPGIGAVGVEQGRGDGRGEATRKPRAFGTSSGNRCCASSHPDPASRRWWAGKRPVQISWARPTRNDREAANAVTPARMPGGAD